MKNPTLQKVALTAVAFVASLALNAQTVRPTVSSAKQTMGSANAKFIHQTLVPTSSYMLDDGTAESEVGETGDETNDLVCLNEFAVIPGSEMINSVSIAWGSPAYFDPTLDGLPYTVALWSDPNGDGDPSDMVLLTFASGVISSQGTDTFITTNITPTTIPTANFFVGFLITTGPFPYQYPAAEDETDPSFGNRSYSAGGKGGTCDIEHLSDTCPLATLESQLCELGLPCGNWLIRADVGGDLNLTSAASRKTHGTKGDFAINLPLTGNIGIECRTGLTRYTVAMTFNNNVTGADSASSSCGTIGSVSVDPADAHNLLVTFNGSACDGSTVTVTATNVHDDQGNTLSSASASMGILVGDVTGDTRVTNGDTAAVQAVQGQQTNSSNFRDDVTLDGKINTQDVQTVRSHRGDVLP